MNTLLVAKHQANNHTRGRHICRLVPLLLLATLLPAFCASTPSCLSPPTGLIGWWPGDGSANDISGTNNGALVGGATATAAGEVGTAFGFNGATACVQIPDAPALRPTNFTVEAWVRFNSLDSTGNAMAGQQYLVFKQNTRSGNFEGIYLAKERRSTGDIFVFGTSSSAGQMVEVDSVTPIATNLWYHLAGVRGSNFLQLYVNGQYIGQSTVSFAQDYGTLPLYFGSSGQSYWDRKLNGSLDEVSLYSRPLASNEIAAIFAAGPAGKCKNSGALTITTPPQSQSIAEGSNAVFSVTASGIPPLFYQWQFNGAPISGATNPVLSLTNVQPSDAGGYNVVVTNSTASVSSATAVLTVLLPPAITSPPSSSTNLTGATVTFTASASGSPPLSYQWKFNGTNLSNGGRISGVATNTLTISNLQFTDAGIYTLLVTNAVGSATSAAATLTVVGPPIINVQPASQTVTVGASVSFSVTASGTPPLIYHWLRNGTGLTDGGNVSGSASAMLSLTNVQLADAANFQVVISNFVGATNSVVAVLTVNPPPVPPIITTPPASQTVNAGTNVTFTVAATGTAPLSYQWLFNGAKLTNGGQFTGATSPSLSISYVLPVNTGNYSVLVTNVAGSATSAAATLAVNLTNTPLPPPAGLIGWWPADGNANDIAGTNNGALVGGATATAAGEVGTAFGFNGATACVQIPDAPALRLTNFTVEAWVRFNSLDSTGNSLAGQQYLVFKQNTRSGNFEGIYLAKERRSTGDIFVFGTSSSAGQMVEVDSVTPIATNLWYHLAGVRGSNFLQLYVNGQYIGQSTVSFAQDYGTLPLYFGSSGQSYWDRKLNGSLDEVSLYNRPLSSNEIAAIFAAGPAGKARVPLITVQPQSLTVAVGQNAGFSVTVSGSLPLSCQWLHDGASLTDGGNVSGARTLALNLANVSTNDSGGYQIVVTNSFGAVASVVAELMVSPSLTAPSIITPPASQTVDAGTNVTFTVTAGGTTPLSYQWLFNGAPLTDGGQFSGTASSSLTITYALPGNSGNYSVQVTNSLGSVTSSAATLTANITTSPIPPPPGLVGWWPGDGSANDIAGTNNGILQGGAVANVPGFVGSAFSFDGTNGYVQVPDSPVFHLPTLTVEAWVRFRMLQTPGNTYYPYQQYIVFKQNSQSAEFEGFVLSKDNDPQGNVILWEVASPTHELIRIDTVNTVTTNVWYHVAGVRGSNFTQVYLNGHLEAEASVGFPQDYGNFPLYFGTSGQSYYDRKLAGELDEVSLYNRALSSNEIAAIYAAGPAGKSKPGQAQSQMTVDAAGVSIQAVASSGNDAQRVLKLTITGTLNHVYGVQFCDELTSNPNWQGLTNLTLSAPTQVWVVPQPLTQKQRFYRIIPGPITLTPQ